MINYWQNTDEEQLLIACCRKVVGNIDEAQFKGLAQKIFDAKKFFQLCQAHGLTVLVYKQFIYPYKKILPAVTVEIFESQTRKIILSQLQLTKVLLDIHRTLVAQGINYVSLKGPVLNQQLFGNEQTRYAGDLDILIVAKDLLKADECLKKIGYRSTMPNWSIRFYSEFYKLFARKDIIYRKENFKPRLELHWKTCPVEMIVNSPYFNWSTHTSFCLINNEALPVLSNYYNCLYLCLHAAKHHWSQLKWLIDIELFIQTQQLDWNQLLALAKQHALENVVEEARMLLAVYLKDKPSGELLLRKTVKQKNLFARMYWANKAKPGLKQKLLLFYYKNKLYSNWKQKINNDVFIFQEAIFNKIIKGCDYLKQVLNRGIK
ncbi:MAG: hypothetical protein A3E87_10890 [Gammaproteobacteria bacterium RIFCSPHIGHO2_12_FULL_35_23]|nr:MAG: hypothetical protein A3E87_10890 [Gammaproteobacteria bacterium RIFCSPHIGHO2_12_FULL_35_23]